MAKVKKVINLYFNLFKNKDSENKLSLEVKTNTHFKDTCVWFVAGSISQAEVSEQMKRLSDLLEAAFIQAKKTWPNINEFVLNYNTIRLDSGRILIGESTFDDRPQETVPSLIFEDQSRVSRKALTESDKNLIWKVVENMKSIKFS